MNNENGNEDNSNQWQWRNNNNNNNVNEKWRRNGVMKTESNQWKQWTGHQY
jgi:hypothetical protein